MKKSRLIAMGISALVFIFAMLNPLESKKGKIPEEELTEVVVAKVNIDSQTELVGDMVELKKIHKDSVPQKAITSIEEVVGKVAMVPMFVGDIFTSEKLEEVGSINAGLAMIIPKGMRAITMCVEEDTGVANLIKVGNKVDIISVIEDKGDNKNEERAILLLENKEILALDKEIGLNSDEKDKDSNYLTITLSVTPEEALKLSLCQVIGKSNRVVLRNQEDLELLGLPDVLPKYLMK